MTLVTIVVPAYNAEATLAETLDSLLSQTFPEFEILVIDDGSSDGTAALAQSYDDPRIRVIRQKNRGLAGARNRGIAEAIGRYIGFCDADDLWRPGKLAAHIAHLRSNKLVGASFSGSELIDETGTSLRLYQRPRLRDISAAHVFRRNPFGNGSTPVFRRAALDEIASYNDGLGRMVWFDESFRQSEDIECWMRFMLTTNWMVEGVPGALTLYRVASGGLSAATGKQYVAWDRLVEKLTPLSPEFFARHTPAARAYQLRYLARRAISARDSALALSLLGQSFAASRRPLWEEPLKSAVTWGAALALRLTRARGGAQTKGRRDPA